MVEEGGGFVVVMVRRIPMTGTVWGVRILHCAEEVESSVCRTGRDSDCWGYHGCLEGEGGIEGLSRLK